MENSCRVIKCFEYHNENPKKLKSSGDCVVRAIAKGTNQKWDSIYDSLTALGLKLKTMPNDKKTYELFLTQNGWLKNRQPRKSDNTKYTVKEFVLEYGKNKTLIISVAGHLTVAVNGIIYDTWDCSHKCVGNYYSKC